MELGPVSVLVLGCGGLWRCLIMVTAALAITSLVDSFCAMPFLGMVAPKMGRLGGLSVSFHCPLSIKRDHNLYCGPLNLSPCLILEFQRKFAYVTLLFLSFGERSFIRTGFLRVFSAPLLTTGYMCIWFSITP